MIAKELWLIFEVLNKNKKYLAIWTIYLIYVMLIVE